MTPSVNTRITTSMARKQSVLGEGKSLTKPDSREETGTFRQYRDRSPVSRPLLGGVIS